MLTATIFNILLTIYFTDNMECLNRLKKTFEKTF